MNAKEVLSRLITSSLWCEPDHTTRIVWVTMLSMANSFGVVYAELPAIAHAACVTQSEAKKALDRLSSPDSQSENKESEGRRITKNEIGGWRIVGFGKDRIARNERQKNYMRTRRAEGKA